MEYANTSGIKSPFSPRVRQSIGGRRPPGLSAAKKNQSKYVQGNAARTGEVIYKTPLCCIETYGMPLPVMVTEALTFGRLIVAQRRFYDGGEAMANAFRTMLDTIFTEIVGGSGSVSVRMSACGWCWLVAGRRVLCWPRDPPTAAGGSSPAPHAAPPAARDLTLPQTDLAHKADLVVLFYEEGAQMPSCIGVSPEGTIRYWPSVTQAGVYVDVCAQLAGQECDRLTEPAPELVLATTTCTIVLLRQMIVDGRATVCCRTLRPPSGWLGGIGRRVSVLFFGSMPAHADTKLVNVVVVREGPLLEPGGGEEPGCVALVTSGGVLQLWRDELHEHDLAHLIHLPQQGEVGSCQVWLDCVAAPRGSGLLLLLLLAGSSAPLQTDCRYAIAHVDVSAAEAPRVVSLVWWRGARCDPEPAPRLLPAAHRLAVYTHKYIAHVANTAGTDKPDVLDVSVEGDRILGAQLCDTVPLVFSSKHGVAVFNTTMCAADTQSARESELGSPSPSDMYDGNLSLYEIDPHEVAMTTTDACGKLKTAFLFHLRRDVTSATTIVQELFPAPPAEASPRAGAAPGESGRSEEDVDAVLDRTVLKIAEEMLDDIPAGDPRWKQRLSNLHTNIPLGSSAALQISSQLRDKQRAFSLFVDFLRAAGLWQRLGLLTRETGGGVVHGTQQLATLAEHVVMALTLLTLQHSHRHILEPALYQVACGENPEVEEDPEVEAALSSGALTPSDVCYRRVTRIERVLRAIARTQPSTSDARAAAQHVAATLHVINTVLSEVHKCRATWRARLGVDASRGAAESGARGLLAALVALQESAVTQYAHSCPDAALQAQLYSEAARLADILLTDAEHLQTSQYTRPHYERLRRDAIQPFMSEGQTERAAALAEKYKDFELLIEMCVQRDDLEKLYSYIDKYQHEGLAEATFAWLCEHGGAHVARLVRDVGVRYRTRLAAWLRATPARASYRALHHLAAMEHLHAARVFSDLADEETESVNRMTTMASLAKLCLVARSAPDDSSLSAVWRKVDSRLALSSQHSALPRDIRLRHGMDQEDTRVHDPAELVQMYTSMESGSLTQYDYKKALDLTDCVADMERRDECRLRVWCAAIRHDSWADASVDSLHDNMFFKVIDLVHIMGGDLELLLPPLEDILTAPELAELVSSPGALYALKYGYECLLADQGLDATPPAPLALSLLHGSV